MTDQNGVTKMTSAHHDPTNLDLVVVGGGPAGMSAALTAGRARLKTAIINSESPRNAVTTASHGFLTRDGAHPSELLATAKEQLAKYKTVSYLNDTVTDIVKSEAGFALDLSGGTRLMANRLVLATGHVDDLDQLGLVGIKEVYGKSIYPCVFCDGFEHQNERLGLFGREGTLHYAPMARLWTDDLIVFTNGAELSADDRDALKRNNVGVHTAPIRRLESKNGRLLEVELETGERIERDAGFISDDYSRPATTFAESLGVTSSLNDWGMTALDADEFGQSTVAGLYVIGDARTGFSGLIAAAAEGAACGETIVHDIATQRWNG